MGLITADHVRDLGAAGPGAALVVIEGQARVRSGADNVDGYLVINREDLRGLMYSGCEARSYDDIARSLNSAVVELGG
jgi:hypothetical protein